MESLAWDSGNLPSWGTEGKSKAPKAVESPLSSRGWKRNTGSRHLAAAGGRQDKDQGLCYAGAQRSPLVGGQRPCEERVCRQRLCPQGSWVLRTALPSLRTFSFGCVVPSRCPPRGILGEVNPKKWESRAAAGSCGRRGAGVRGREPRHSERRGQSPSRTALPRLRYLALSWIQHLAHRGQLPRLVQHPASLGQLPSRRPSACAPMVSSAAASSRSAPGRAPLGFQPRQEYGECLQPAGSVPVALRTATHSFRSTTTRR